MHILQTTTTTTITTTTSAATTTTATTTTTGTATATTTTTTGQIHEVFKSFVFVNEQIRANLEHFEGSVKRSKVRSYIYMNWWVKCISAVIVKTASRNVAFKATRMRDSITEGQDKFVMRELDNADVDLREDCEL